MLDLTSNSSCGRASAKQFWWALAFFGSLPAATLVLRHLPLPPAIRLLLPALPLGTGVMYLLTIVEDLRHQVDELQRRIYLEAAAVVVCGLFIIMLMYPTFQEARVLPARDYSIVVALIVVLDTGRYLGARPRYR